MQTIIDLQDYLGRNSSELANTSFECPHCGRVHKIPFGIVESGSGVLAQIPTIAQKILGGAARAPWVVYDRAIEEIIQASVIAPLERIGFRMHPLALGEKGSLLDSEDVVGDQAAAQVSPQADLLIGAGSGVICDLTKWIATRIGRPFITLGSAPSMNAYTSITATITKQGIKLSEWLNPADAVVMDAEILKDAPMAMIHAGMGDLAARAICNADWKLGQQLKGAYFCPLPFQMTAAHERRYLDAAEDIRRRDPQAIQHLSEAILISGYSMTVLDGETSSSSGAEHVLSHFWDLMTHLRNAPQNLHGAQVGVGTMIMLAMYAYVRRLNPAQFCPQRLLRERPTLDQIESENRAHFGDKAESFNAVARAKYLPDDQYLAFVRRIITGWDELWQALDPYVGHFESIRARLAVAGVPLTLAGIQRSREDGVEALLFGGRYRSRYTLLDLAWELGIFPDAAQDILQSARVLD